MWLFVGLPIIFLVVIGECLPRGTPETAICDAQKRFDVFAAVFGSPLLAAAGGWMMYRLSKFLG